MPELPEVETTRRGIAPFLTGQRIAAVNIYNRELRWPVTADLPGALTGQRVETVERRAKYLLLRTGAGTVIMHLGMSGSLRVVAASVPPGLHDHIEFRLADDRCLRFRDPRRFGCILWTRADPLTHPLLRELGPEPLGPAFSGDYLYELSRHRRSSIKTLLMDSRAVSGIGNIYASEALFRGGIHPMRAAGRVGRQRCERLVDSIRQTLETAIAAGGTSLRDFTHEDGTPGYFRHQLQVYDRENLPCFRCKNPIRRRIIAQRSTYFCPRCQR